MARREVGDMSLRKRDFGAYRDVPREMFSTTGNARTDTSQGDSCDVNLIYERFARSGVLPVGRQGQFADVSGLAGDMGERISRFVEVSERYESGAAEFRARAEAEANAEAVALAETKRRRRREIQADLDLAAESKGS